MEQVILQFFGILSTLRRCYLFNHYDYFSIEEFEILGILDWDICGVELILYWRAKLSELSCDHVQFIAVLNENSNVPLGGFEFFSKGLGVL